MLQGTRRARLDTRSAGTWDTDVTAIDLRNAAPEVSEGVAPARVGQFGDDHLIAITAASATDEATAVSNAATLNETLPHTLSLIDG